ncbi:hypothetical protein WJX73_006089 [Symbiochloris irregularis]|uniref:Protein kinase domain-containing protein n=1 Tax=Symbiochloris irregularis TaxID=706552 RepID=A0AAW1NUS5_9CHLO
MAASAAALLLLVLARLLLSSGQAPAPAPAEAHNITELADLLVDFVSTFPDLSLPAGQWQRNGNPCSANGSWEYVTCSGDHVKGINFTDVHLSGPIQSSWTPLLAVLTDITLSNASLSGTLPPDWGSALVNAKALDLSNQMLTGELPLEWGMDSSFPSLRAIDLSGNPLVSSLPDWGADGTAMQTLEALKLSDFPSCLQGTLPGNWSMQLPSMTYLDLSGCASSVSGGGLVGTLPEEWSAWNNLTYLNLNENSLTGQLPESWGGAWPHIGSLILSFNSLSGTIPDAWGSGWPSLLTGPNGTSNCTGLILFDNQISGTIPQSFAGSGGLTALPGNAGLCNASSNLQPSPIIYSALQGVTVNGTAPYFVKYCSQDPQAASAKLPLQCPALAGTGNASEATTGLLHFAQTLPKFNPSGTGWVAGDSDVCDWEYVICDNDTLKLDLSNIFLEGYLQPSWGQDLAEFDILLLSNTQLRGQLPAAWASHMTSLQNIDLSLNADIYGPIPRAWSQPDAFPSLMEINVYQCNLSGSLPDLASSAMPQLQRLYASSQNGQQQAGTPGSAGFQGSLPASWGATRIALIELHVDDSSITGTVPAEWGADGAFPSLQLLSLKANRIAGTLPPWGQFRGLPALKTIALDSNGPQNHGEPRFVAGPGTLPSELADSQSLQVVSMVSNRFQGTLPAEWGQAGKLLNLTDLYLGGNQVTGTLPDWGLTGGMAALQVMSVVDNRLAEGPIPDWGPDGKGLHNLQTIQGSESSMSIGAGSIAGIVVGSVAAVAIFSVLGFLIWRRTKGKPSRPAEEANSSLMTGQTHSTNSSYDPSPLDIFLGHSSLPEASRSRLSNLSGTSSSGTPANTLAGAMLQLDWRIDPHRIKISTLPNGRHILLGTGGFGAVYKGLLDGDLEVAIKLMKPDQSYASSSIAKFIAEIDVLRACRDMHIVAFNGAWASEDIMYFICEFCHNGDLYSALAHDRFTDMLSWYNRGKSIALQVARGLFYLHSNGIVHLDIKSPNILLTKEWQAKIADVGLARTLLSKTHLSRTLPGGTYNWQAPETILGFNATFSADIFSYGVVLLEITTGLRPVRGAYPRPQ